MRHRSAHFGNQATHKWLVMFKSCVA
jgi:hypothetical protein